MAEPLPKDHRCSKCGEWYHNAHACPVEIRRAQVNAGEQAVIADLMRMGLVPTSAKPDIPKSIACKRALYWRDEFGNEETFFEDWMQEEMDMGTKWQAVFEGHPARTTPPKAPDIGIPISPELERDALRYRWLRQRNAVFDAEAIFTATSTYSPDGRFTGNDLLSLEEMDDAIDTAMQASKGAT